MILEKEHITVKKVAMQLRHLPKCTVFDILLKTEILFNTIETPITRNAIDHVLFHWEYPRAVPLPNGGFGILIDGNLHISVYRELRPNGIFFSLKGNNFYFKVTNGQEAYKFSKKNLKKVLRQTKYEAAIHEFLNKYPFCYHKRNEATGRFLLIEFLEKHRKKEVNSKKG